jgi:hypothetical protein
MPHHEKPAVPAEAEIAKKLDELFAKVKSRTIVEFEGKQYQIRYFPLSKSPDGAKVEEWGHRWVLMDEEQ